MLQTVRLQAVVPCAVLRRLQRLLHTREPRLTGTPVLFSTSKICCIVYCGYLLRIRAKAAATKGVA